MNCPICGTGKARKVRTAYRTNYAGQPVSLTDVEMFRCSECQEEFFSPEQARSVSVEVKNAVRQQFGLLSPERIVAIREKLRLTQAELEYLFDQGPKVVTRWESGRVIQNQNADMLLRLLDRKPELLDVIRAIAESRAKAQRKYSRSEEAVATA